MLNWIVWNRTICIKITYKVIVFNWNHFEMRLLNLRINFIDLLRTFCPHLSSFLCCFFFTTFRPIFTSGLLQVILPRPRIGMLSLVTVSPVIKAFHSCCLSHQVFDQVNLWPAWIGIETAIFWQCSPGTVETQRLYPLRHGPQKEKKGGGINLQRLICHKTQPTNQPTNPYQTVEVNHY